MHFHFISNLTVLAESFQYILHEQILKSETDLKNLNEMEIVSSIFEEQQTR